jgi:hypothetical protein
LKRKRGRFQKLFRFGAGDANYSELFAPFSLGDYAIIHFTKLMEIYSVKEEEF